MATNLENWITKRKIEFNEGKWDSFDEYLDDYIKRNPKDNIAYVLRGEGYKGKNNYEKALQDFNKAIEIDPNFVEAYTSRGLLYLDMNEFDKAIEDNSFAVKLSSTDTVAYYNRAIAYINKKDYSKALIDLKKTVEIDPEYADAYKKLGAIYVERDSEKEALSNFKKYIELEPNSADAKKIKDIIYTSQQASKPPMNPQLKTHLVLMGVGCAIGLILGLAFGMTFPLPFIFGFLGLGMASWFSKRVGGVHMNVFAERASDDFRREGCLKGLVSAIFSFAWAIIFTLVRGPFVAISSCFSFDKSTQTIDDSHLIKSGVWSNLTSSILASTQILGPTKSVHTSSGSSSSESNAKKIPRKIKIDDKWYDVSSGWSGTLNMSTFNGPLEYTASEPYAHMSNFYFVYNTNGSQVGGFDANNGSTSGSVSSIEM